MRFARLVPLRLRTKAKRGLFVSCGLAAASLFSETAAAQVAPGDPPESQDPSVAFSAGVATDYMFRGVSQTDGGPQVFGTVDFKSGPFYAGAFVSNVKFVGDRETDGEIDLYVGYKPVVGRLTFDIAVLGYFYLGQPQDAGYNYVEAKLAVSAPAGKGTIGGALFLTPNNFGAAEREAAYFEINGSYPITDSLSLSGAAGRQFVSSNLDYNTANIGAAYTPKPWLMFDVRAHFTDAQEFGSPYRNRVVASVKAIF